MRSRTSFFSPGLARKSLTRFWPVWGVYLAVWLLFMPAALWSGRYYGDLAKLPVRCDGTVAGFMGMAAALMTSVGAIFAASAVWSYLFNPRAATFYHTLPIRREGLFVTHYLTGLGFLVVPAVMTALVTYITELALGYTGGLPMLLEWLAVMLLLSIFFFSLATFCAFLTGHPVALPILYFLLNFAVVVVEYLIRNALSTFLNGVSFGSPRLAALSPLVNLYYTANADYSSPAAHYGAFGYLGVLTLAAGVLAFCALLLYRRRHIETAQDVIAVPFLRPVFRVLFSLGCAVVLGSALFTLIDGEGRLSYALSVLFGGLIGYLAAEMLLCKSFRVLRGCWKRLCVLLTAVLLLVGCITFDLFGVAKWTPDPADVDYVILNGQQFSEPADIARIVTLHASAQGEPYVDDCGDQAYCIDLRYMMRDGRTIRRDYSIAFDPADLADVRTTAGLCCALLSTEDVLTARLLPPDGARIYTVKIERWEESASRIFELADDDFDGFFDAVRSDALEGTLGHWEIYGLGVSDAPVCAAVRIEFRPTPDAAIENIGWDLRDSDEHICAFLRDNGYWE